ncbi:MAG: class I SAM-dependent methyltransferase [Candidatus Aenigmarchaeota archaeon]|nr:class I SAM-dependent methyltransferase [Candidatus Aenigmarchaeota archaeon]
MFTPQVYDSWQDVQWEKYDEFLRIMGRDFFSSILEKRVLDIGSGSGYLERFLVSKEFDVKNVVSLDIRKDFMKKVDKETLVIGDAKFLPFKNGRFDAVVSVDTMHLVKDTDFARVLKPGGLALLSVFFSHGVYEERRNLLRSLLTDFQIIFEFEIHGKEKEYVILARKTN